MADVSRSGRVLRILFDVNVLLDVILEREPYVRTAAELAALVETGRLHGLISAVTIPIVHYVVRRELDRQKSLVTIRRLLELFDVAPVTGAVLGAALELGFGDYEDAIQHEAARHAVADGIVTRNVAAFKSATLSVHAPEELLQAIRAA